MFLLFLFHGPEKRLFLPKKAWPKGEVIDPAFVVDLETQGPCCSSGHGKQFRRRRLEGSI